MPRSWEEFRILQPFWDLRIGYEFYVRSPLFPIVMSICFYFGLVSLITIVDMYCKNVKWIMKYKVQPEKEVTWKLVRRGISLTLWNHLVYILPISIAQWIWTPYTVLPELAPTVFEFWWKQIAALVVFDIEYYLLHWSFHKVRFLYRHVHAIHHEYSSPIAWTTQYLHPWELIPVGIFTTTSPMVFNSDPMTTWSFMIFAIWVSVDNHWGYDLPFMPHHWFPFWGGILKHDMHHQRPLTNFQPFFNYFDRLFGTECPGVQAGGYKTPELLEWERKNREAKMARLLVCKPKDC
jgi:cholesterol 25-hydroxylase